MNAILLSAGLAKRLRPLTLHTPKCLIKIKGIPIIDIWIEHLLDIGIDKIFINTHYLHEKIDQHIQNHKFKNRIEIFYEKKILGTAKSVLEIYNKNKTDLLIAHSDNYFEDNLSNLIKSFNSRPKNSLATLMSFRVKDPINYGIFKFNKDHILEKFYEKQDVKIYDANAAVYIFSKKLFDTNLILKSDTDLSKDVIPRLIHKSNIYFSKKKFVDIGVIERLKQLI